MPPRCSPPGSKNIKLPSQTKNNFLIICGVGAYGSVMASNYNSKCLPAEVLVKHDQHAIIRHQEQIEELKQQVALQGITFETILIDDLPLYLSKIK